MPVVAAPKEGASAKKMTRLTVPLCSKGALTAKRFAENKCSKGTLTAKRFAES